MRRSARTGTSGGLLRVAVATLACLAAVLVWSPTASAQAPTPPAQPTGSAPGSQGPCGKSTTSAPNQQFGDQTVWLFQPSGTGVPRTGGTCGDSQRPLVLVVHGWTFGSPAAPDPHNTQVIDNLVSHGNIVVFANYHGPDMNSGAVYDEVDAGFAQAAGMTSRESTAHVGIWGHSYGGGMVPWLAQQAGARGWGSGSLWLGIQAPYFPLRVGANPGAITVPAGARAHVVNYEDDQVGYITDWASAEIYNRLALAAGTHKRHITIRSDNRNVAPCPCPADHFTVNQSAPVNHLMTYGAFRSWQVLSDCVRTGANCNANMASMGHWSDGQAVPPARLVPA